MSLPHVYRSIAWVAVFLVGSLCSAAALAQTLTVGEPPRPDLVEPTLFFDTDERWLVWADALTPPPEWPLASLPAEVSDISEILGEPEFMDRVVRLYDALWTPQYGATWWEGAFAPFSVRETAFHRSLADERESLASRRLRDGTPLISQTVFLDLPDPAIPPPPQLLGTNPPPELAQVPRVNTLYVARTFEVEDPSRWVSLLAEVKFSAAVVVWINGTEVLRHNIAPGASVHGAMAQTHPLPEHVSQTFQERWQRSTMGIPADLLVPGENTIAAMVLKRERGERRPVYFDMSLRGFDAVGFTKSPYLQNLRLDGVTVAWETTVPAYGYVEVREQGTQRWTPVTMPSFAGTHHEVVVRGLAADTAYEYRAVSVPIEFGATPAAEPFSSERASFRTGAPRGVPISFILYGDNRTQSEIHERMVRLMWDEFVSNGARFVVHTGDLVTRATPWAEWQSEFFAPALPLLGHLPYYTSLGNHEGNHEQYYYYLDLPGNEAWYTFSQGDVDFFALNSSLDFSEGSAQYMWVDEALQASNARWKIVFFHHPPYACTPSRKPGDEDVQEWLVPLFESRGVDLVLLGHDHLYGRSANLNGIHYVISGGGGAPSYPAEPDAVNPVCVRAYHYCRVDVTSDTLTLTAIADSGEIIDTLSLPAP